MHIGFLSTKQACEFLPHMEKLLARKGHEIACSVCVSGEVDFAETLNYVAMQSQAIIYYGDRNRLFDTLKNDYNVDPKQSVFELNDTFYAVMDEYDESFVRESIIPMLNGRCKTLYTTEIFKTFGREENELKDLLKNHIKNRNRIVFSFYPSVCECEVAVRYSSKMPRDTVNAVVGGARAALKSFTYSESDATLAECRETVESRKEESLCGGVFYGRRGGIVFDAVCRCKRSFRRVCRVLCKRIENTPRGRGESNRRNFRRRQRGHRIRNGGEYVGSKRLRHMFGNQRQRRSDGGKRRRGRQVLYSRRRFGRYTYIRT